MCINPFQFQQKQRFIPICVIYLFICSSFKIAQTKKSTACIGAVLYCIEDEQINVIFLLLKIPYRNNGNGIDPYIMNAIDVKVPIMTKANWARKRRENNTNKAQHTTRLQLPFSWRFSWMTAETISWSKKNNNKIKSNQKATTKMIWWYRHYYHWPKNWHQRIEPKKMKLLKKRTFAHAHIRTFGMHLDKKSPDLHPSLRAALADCGALRNANRRKLNCYI